MDPVSESIFNLWLYYLHLKPLSAKYDESYIQCCFVTNRKRFMWIPLLPDLPHASWKLAPHDFPLFIFAKVLNVKYTGSSPNSSIMIYFSVHLQDKNKKKDTGASFEHYKLSSPTVEFCPFHKAAARKKNSSFTWFGSKMLPFVRQTRNSLLS